MKRKDIISTRERRVYMGEQSFWFFLLYYFSKHLRYPEMAAYQKERAMAWTEWFNIYCEAHRDAAKTTILWIAFSIWKICYNKTYFMCNIAHDGKKAASLNLMIVNELLINKYIIEDFWQLYKKKHGESTDDFMDKKWVSHFNTTNGVIVKAFWMGESLRWQLENSKEHWLIRPDHLLFDDVDNTRNTKNPRLIEEDISFIRWEIIWAAGDPQIIWLWNVIRRYWRNPSQREHVRWDKNWKVFENFIYWEKGLRSWTPAWSRFVNTDEEMKKQHKKWNMVLSLETKKSSEWSDYNQNYLWIEMKPWDTVIDYELIKYWSESDFDYIWIGCDPAFSTKTWSDAFGIVVTGHKEVWWTLYYYVLESVKLTGQQKKQNTAEQIVENIYHKRWASRIRIEKNNWWEYFADGLIRRWLAVDKLATAKDKLTRVKEHEWIFQRWQIFFTKWNEKLIDQIILFTWEDGNEDDLVDWLLFSIDQEWWVDVLF